MVESTWDRREVPILEAAAELAEAGEFIQNTEHLAEAAGLPLDETVTS